MIQARSARPPRDPKPARNWVPLWTVPVLILMAIGTVTLRLSIVRITYSIGQMDQRIRTLSHEREQAELRLSSLRSPRKLEQLARTRFNLSQPRSDQVIYVK